MKLTYLLQAVKEMVDELRWAPVELSTGEVRMVRTVEVAEGYTRDPETGILSVILPDFTKGEVRADLWSPVCAVAHDVVGLDVTSKHCVDGGPFRFAAEKLGLSQEIARYVHSTDVASCADSRRTTEIRSDLMDKACPPKLYRPKEASLPWFRENMLVGKPTTEGLFRGATPSLIHKLTQGKQ